jgi:hypothetical protein
MTTLAPANTLAYERRELVPGEGIEPPTNGLQNRCSTAELTRPVGLESYQRRPLVTSGAYKLAGKIDAEAGATGSGVPSGNVRSPTSAFPAR